MRPRVILIVAIVLAAGVALTALVGSYSWRSSTAALNAGLEAERVPSAVAVYHVDELAGLPEPVVDYFRSVLREGQPMVSAATIGHRGTFNANESGEDWKPFTST